MHRVLSRILSRGSRKCLTLEGADYYWSLYLKNNNLWRPEQYMRCNSLRLYSSNNDNILESDHYSGTLAEVAEKVRKGVGIEISYSAVPKTREHLLEHQPEPENLPERSMHDSHTNAVLPLGSDEVIRERYVNNRDRVRLGRIMEELDMFAVWLCHRHVNLPKLPPDVPLPYTFVTLLVDKVDFTNIDLIKSNMDIEFSGHISWTGRSSMESTIYVRQKDQGQYWTITKAIFLMVARNATNTGSAPINSLKPANEMERIIWDKAVKRQKVRRTRNELCVFSSPPMEFEQHLMYNLFWRTASKDCMELNKRVLPPKCRWMEDASLTTVISPFPENRNSQNTIFGGYIMRNALEISFVTASLYISERPILKCISDISFMNPVKVTSILKMTAYVVFTAQNYVQIMTVAEVCDARIGEELTTNAFHLTYKTDKFVDEVLPRSYHETLWYINGRRKFMAAFNKIPEYTAE